MIAKFNNLELAIAYVNNGLAGSGSPGVLELSAAAGGRGILGSKEVPSATLREALETECRRFPEATAVFGESPAGQLYAALQCRCVSTARKYCPRHCAHVSDRPLMLILTHAPEPGAREEILKKVLDEIKEDAKIDRNRADGFQKAHQVRRIHRPDEKGTNEFRKQFRSN